MNRREFLALGPAFPAATVSASLVVKEDGKPELEVGVNVLRLKPGDTLVLRCPGTISPEAAERLKYLVESEFTGIKAMILSDGITLDGILR